MTNKLWYWVGGIFAVLVAVWLGSAFIMYPQTSMPTGTATTTTPSTAVAFSASLDPAAPLAVEFTSTAPQGSSVGTSVNFGDGTSGSLGVVPVCSGCDARAVASHTYAAPGTYTATLTSGSCACPAGGICNCPNVPVLSTLQVTVSAPSTLPATQQVNAPATVSLKQGGIAEVRNKSFYFTLQRLTTSTATIEPTQVGCWNSFPSDIPPKIRCMIAVVPIPPQTLSLGQTYTAANYSVTLTQISGGVAVFAIK